MGQLDDELGEVGLVGPDARRLEHLVEADLLRCHRLDLDHLLGAAGPDQAGDDGARLGGVTCPMHDAAPRGHCRLKLLEQFGQPGHRLGLDGSTGIAQRLPIGNLRHGDGTFGPDGGGGVPQIPAKLLVCQRLRRRRGEGPGARQLAAGAGGRAGDARHTEEGAQRSLLIPGSRGSARGGRHARRHPPGRAHRRCA